MKQENEIHVLDFDEEAGGVRSIILNHPQEVTGITPSNSEENVFFTCSTALADGYLKYQANLYRYQLSVWQDKTARGNLEQLCSLTEFEGQINKLAWDPTENSRSVALVDETQLRIYKLRDGASQIKPEMSIQVPGNKGQIKLHYVAYNPHQTHELMTLNDCCVRGWDTRSSEQSWILERANTLYARDMDMNPNRPYYFVTAGDDAKLRFYDQRQLKAPLKEVTQHTHWVWSIEYNQFYDQLVLSGGSDAQVILNHVVSLSSAAAGQSHSADEMSEGEDSKKRFKQRTDENKRVKDTPGDSVLAILEQHEESVYGVSWSRADPWVFGSVSHEGRVVINTVSSDDKYKIILP